ncbi:ABC transporter ATP-binding protein [Rhodococcus sp. NBC_00297]|uniref:ABC transporter ATP-binding protein n=1 Tax=Rhodococcus sp. NBC_00297 TaxID=2976005 RepID=UPI002E2969A0|nr:ABC transporter ATP-binding protein [Rhodococcus sp. NBC_00297]
MAESVLSMVGVCKAFRKTSVLENCSFEVPRGSVTALVGSNGAGKSTLMSLIVGLLAPDAGSITVLGTSVGQQGISPGLSYLAQHRPLYGRFTVADMLRFGRETNQPWDQQYATRLVAAAGISMTSRVRALSPGHRTRVALAVALGRRPEVLLLDEPFADLDPVARRDVAQALMSHAAEFDTTMVISSHVLAELADIADHLMLLSHGAVRVSGPLDTVTADHYLLRGRGDPSDVIGTGSIVSEMPGTGGAVFIAQGPKPADAGEWQIDDATLDDIVIAHLTGRSSE